ncbi:MULTISPECIES: YopX family protein [unclassified Streptococcus]|uniref:YopX family protein n=1 Tax=unclassified Streptococcus TaxID=2608887 RepID=UPI001566135A|nr:MULTISPECIES: YopX family protein [unclassified Streptococcus]DAS40453.1 MAG TPA: YopX protein [Caudoviricetes sp.]
MIPKFRAWDSAKKKFVEHFFITDNGLICNMEKPTSDCKLLIPIEKSELILMQSTGLKDKNGKEVFVGDIIKCTRGCLHEVYIEKEYGGTYFGGMPAVYLKDLGEGYAWTEHEEIIGNIYENRELLEDKE